VVKKKENYTRILYSCFSILSVSNNGLIYHWHVSTGIPKLQINTDSQFLIRCVTEWAPKWRKNDWKLSSGGDVKNKVQLQNLHSVYDGIDIKWVSNNDLIEAITISDLIFNFCLRTMFKPIKE